MALEWFLMEFKKLTKLTKRLTFSFGGEYDDLIGGQTEDGLR
jgi:hypothetical protein